MNDSVKQELREKTSASADRAIDSMNAVFTKRDYGMDNIKSSANYDPLPATKALELALKREEELQKLLDAYRKVMDDFVLNKLSGDTVTKLRDWL